jgi:hypothetical protein
MAMLVLALGSLFLLLIVPVAAWALAARTTLPGLTLAAVLLTCGAGWIWLMAGRVPPGQVANSVLALTAVTPAVILAGRLDRDTSVRLRPPGRARLFTGPALSAVCVCLNVLAGVVLILGSLFQVFQSHAYTPPSSDVLPLPPALSVVSDQDQGCSSGCGRSTSAARPGCRRPRRRRSSSAH